MRVMAVVVCIESAVIKLQSAYLSITVAAEMIFKFPVKTSFHKP